MYTCKKCTQCVILLTLLTLVIPIEVHFENITTEENFHCEVLNYILFLFKKIFVFLVYTKTRYMKELK